MNQIDKETLIAYLYGELSETEMQGVQQAIKGSEALRNEFEQLKQMKSVLSQLPDKQPSMPLVLMDLQGKKNHSKPTNFLGLNGFTQAIVAVAASVALFVILGAITDLRISNQKNEFIISFGKPETSEPNKVENTEPKKPENVQLASQTTDTSTLKNLVNKQLQEKQSDWDAQMASLRNQMNKKPYVTEERSFSKKEMEALVQQIRQEDFDMMQKMMAVSSSQQKDFLEKSLNAYAQFWEKQRQKDLNEIGETMISFKQQTEEKLKDNDLVLSRLVSAKK